MKAWRMIAPNQPLQLCEVSDPVAGEGEVIIDVKVAGLCHSDVSMLRSPNPLSTLRSLPRTLGHEIAGVVASVGENVPDWKIGDRAGVCPTASAALPGQEGPRAAEVAPGYGRDGGFAEKYLGPAHDLVRIPEGVDIVRGAVATDAGMTSYHALVVRGGLQAGMKVGIIGLGGLGQIAAGVTTLKGAELHVAERRQEIWPLATKLGAKSVVADVADWRGGGFDLIVDYAGFSTTTAGALQAIRFDGTVVQVGLGKPDITIAAADLVLSHGNLLGSVGGTKQDIEDLYSLMAEGSLSPVITEIGFDDIPAGITDLEEGRVTGRPVARIG
jgi:propanol-preferring alcohol dehydrogenase